MKVNLIFSLKTLDIFVGEILPDQPLQKTATNKTNDYQNDDTGSMDSIAQFDYVYGPKKQEGLKIVFRKRR